MAFLSKTTWCIKHFILTVIKILENCCVSKSGENITEMKRFSYFKLFLKLPQHTTLPGWAWSSHSQRPIALQGGEWDSGRMGFQRQFLSWWVCEPCSQQELPEHAQNSALGGVLCSLFFSRSRSPGKGCLCSTDNLVNQQLLI